MNPFAPMKSSDDTIKSDLEQLVGDERFADIVFRFANGAEVVHAHRNILCARSPVMMQSLLPTGDWHQKKEVRLDEGVEAVSFLYLLKYMYSSKCELPYDQVHSLLLLAHRFQVQGLVENCERYLASCLTPDNILMNLEVAEICGLGVLKAKCADKLQEPGVLSQLLSTDALRKVALPGLRALLSMEPLPIEELTLFLVVVRWGAAQVGEDIGDEPRPVSREVRELCAPLLELIRLPTMSHRELTKVVKPYDIVDQLRYIEAIEYVGSVDSDDDDHRSISLARFRPRNHGAEQPTARNLIRQKVNRLTQSPSASPLQETTTPRRGLPSLSAMGAWQMQSHSPAHRAEPYISPATARPLRPYAGVGGTGI